MIYDSNPPHPLNKKRENIEERVLKGKLFKNSVQQSNSPTALYFLKCNSLLYSSIYSFLNYIYTTHLLFCRMLLDSLLDVFSTVQQEKKSSIQQKTYLLDVLDVQQHYFRISKFA